MAEGLATGYFEPQIEARRQPQGAYRVPLYAPPLDLGQRSPYWTRQQLDTLPAAKAALLSRCCWRNDVAYAHTRRSQYLSLKEETADFQLAMLGLQKATHQAAKEIKRSSRGAGFYSFGALDSKAAPSQPASQPRRANSMASP